MDRWQAMTNSTPLPGVFDITKRRLYPLVGSSRAWTQTEEKFNVKTEPET
jgi:hypothetical protein